MKAPTQSWRSPVPPGIEEKFVSVDGHRIRYLTAGSGPNLLLVHGLMGYSFSWTEILPELAKRFRIFAPDLLNLGFSARAEADPALPAIAERMFKFLDAVGVARADVMGSSHGGTIALQMAARERGRVDRLVLVAPSHPWSESGRWQIRLFATPLGPPLAALMSYAPRVWMAVGLFRLYARHQRMPRGTISGYARPMHDRRTLAYLLQIARRWEQDFAGLRAGLARATDVPTLLIWGDRDPIVPLRTADDLQKHLRCAELQVIPDCGHLPYEERPEEFLSAVLTYLSSPERCRA